MTPFEDSVEAQSSDCGLHFFFVTTNSNDTLAARLGYALHEKKDLFIENQLADLANTAARVSPRGSFASSPKPQMSGLEENLKKFILDGEGYEPDRMTDPEGE
jgi:hypothetical protein